MAHAYNTQKSEYKSETRELNETNFTHKILTLRLSNTLERTHKTKTTQQRQKNVVLVETKNELQHCGCARFSISIKLIHRSMFMPK